MRTHHCSNCGADVHPEHAFVTPASWFAVFIMGLFTCGVVWLGTPLLVLMSFVPTCPYCRHPVSRIINNENEETELPLDN